MNSNNNSEENNSTNILSDLKEEDTRLEKITEEVRKYNDILI
jgi:hypothetical protein